MAENLFILTKSLGLLLKPSLKGRGDRRPSPARAVVGEFPAEKPLRHGPCGRRAVPPPLSGEALGESFLFRFMRVREFVMSEVTLEGLLPPEGGGDLLK